MEIKIQSIQCNPDDAFLDSITTNLGKIKKMYDRIKNADVILRHNKDNHKRGYCVEISLSVPGQQLFAVESEETFGQALDKVISDLKKQITRYKGRLTTVERVKLNVEE